MLRNLPRPTIFAHRGSSANAPENTLSAFELALKQQADGIELDAKLSADQVVVVIHDQTVDRTTNGTGRVRDLPLAALRELDAGSFFDVAFKNEPIPTLEEVFETIGHQTFINVELTNYNSPFDQLPEKVVELVKRHRMSTHVLFSSFHPLVLRRIHRLLPEIPVGFLALPGRSGALARSRIGKLIVPYQAIHPELSDATYSLINRAHQAGHIVNVYTVNREEDMRQLFNLEVDGIFTDDPLLARQVLADTPRIR
ncbi:MAG TPA: glycerophosphodiester phosphodiesterase family protein [Anaerolineales bacterium]|nr:glycerophosphodiester phosphodiesterase family protein [Anaerolineales bacterium]